MFSFKKFPKKESVIGKKIRFVQKENVFLESSPSLASGNVIWVLKKGTYVGTITQTWGGGIHQVMIDVSEMLAILVRVSEKNDEVEILP